MKQRKEQQQQKHNDQNAYRGKNQSHYIFENRKLMNAHCTYEQ